MSDCGEAGLVPNRVAECENQIAVLQATVARLRGALAECRAALHEAGLTFMDKDPQPLGKSALPARTLRFGWAK